MKKLVALIFFLVIAISAFTACENKVDSSTSIPEESSSSSIIVEEEEVATLELLQGTQSSQTGQ